MPVLTLAQPPDSLLYPYTVDVWRPTVQLGGDGQPTGTIFSWSKILTGTPCYAKLTPNQLAANYFLQAEEDNFFSMDEFRFPADVELQATDVLVLNSYPNAVLVGKYWRVRGNPENHDFIAGYQVVRAKATIPPEGVG